MTAKTVLITGLNGMLGQDLAPAMRERGYEVVGATSQQLNLLETDDALFQKVSHWKPAVIVHGAAYTNVDGAESNPDLAMAVNKEGSKKMALLAQALDVPLIMISTDYVFDGTKRSPYTSKDKTNPQSVYGLSKYYGELIISELLENYCILRTSWLYGAHKRNFVQQVVDAPREGRTLTILTDQVGSPTWTGSLSQQILYAIENNCRGTFHAADIGNISRYEQALEICRQAGLGTDHIKPITSESLSLPAKRPAYSVLDTGPLPAVDWREALKNYLKQLATLRQASSLN